MTATTSSPASVSAVEDLLTDRYGAEVAGGYPVLDNPTIRLALGHRSVRAFAPAPLAPEVLPTLIAAAQSASTSSNLQVWSVIAIRDPEHKARLAVGTRNENFVRQAPLFLIWLADFSRARQVSKDQ